MAQQDDKLKALISITDTLLQAAQAGVLSKDDLSKLLLETFKPIESKPITDGIPKSPFEGPPRTVTDEEFERMIVEEARRQNSEAFKKFYGAEAVKVRTLPPQGSYFSFPPTFPTLPMSTSAQSNPKEGCFVTLAALE